MKKKRVIEKNTKKLKQEKCFQNKKTISFRFKKTKKIQKLGIKVKVKKTKQKTKIPVFYPSPKKGT